MSEGEDLISRIKEDAAGVSLDVLKELVTNASNQELTVIGCMMLGDGPELFEGLVMTELGKRYDALDSK